MFNYVNLPNGINVARVIKVKLIALTRFQIAVMLL
jgi:hypothetical protein